MKRLTKLFPLSNSLSQYIFSLRDPYQYLKFYKLGSHWLSAFQIFLEIGDLVINKCKKMLNSLFTKKILKHIPEMGL